jgi:hypothetical protein
MDNDISGGGLASGAPAAPPIAPPAPAPSSAPSPSPAAPPAAEAPSLRQTLEAAIAAKEPSQAQRQRDAAGRFAGKGGEAPSGQLVPTEDEVRAANRVQQPGDQTQQAPQQGEGEHEEQQLNIDAAPKSWKGPLKEKWAGLESDVRAEITRRERDMARAMNEHAPVRQFTQQFSEVIQPFAHRYQGMNIPPLQLFKNFMESDTLLATAPMAVRGQFMARMIKEYGIDIDAIDMALAGEDPATRPESQLESLIDKKLAPIQQFVQSQQQRVEAARQTEYSAQARKIQTMAQDAINFPHMGTVAADMADLMEMNMKRGIYLTPEEAYKRAVAINPEAQQAVQSAAGQQRANEAHDAATRSLGASLSVSGAPAGLKQRVDPSDLRGTIEAAYSQAMGR